MLLSIAGITIKEEIIESATDMAIMTIAKAVPEESLCIAVIDKILERVKEKVIATPITSFQQYLEENKK